MQRLRSHAGALHRSEPRNATTPCGGSTRHGRGLQRADEPHPVSQPVLQPGSDGSNNGLDPWFGDATPPGETPEQTRAHEKEVRKRIDANVRWLEDTFKDAHNEEPAGVALFFHVDLYHPGDRFDPDAPAQFFAREAFAEKIVELAAGFDGPVLLVSGDTHNYVEYTGSP